MSRAAFCKLAQAPQSGWPRRCAAVLRLSFLQLVRGPMRDEAQGEGRSGRVLLTGNGPHVVVNVGAGWLGRVVS